jgi:hypothetical protein
MSINNETTEAAQTIDHPVARVLKMSIMVRQMLSI